MRRGSLAYIVVVLTVLLALLPSTAPAADEIGRHIAKSSYADVIFELDNAIVSRGLAIHSSGNQFARMLERTGADIGSTARIYSEATFVEICSAKHARMMVEAEPALITNCPFIFYVYVLPERPKEVVVAFRRLTPGTSPAAQKAIAETEALLDAIARDAAK